MAYRRKFWLLFAFAYLSAVMLPGELTPTPGTQSIPTLFAHSSLVLKGEITSVSESGEIEGFWHGERTTLRRFRASAKVDRLYKGQSPDGFVSIHYERPTESMCTVSRCVTFSPGEYGLFFLAGNAGNYQLGDEFFGKFTASQLNAAEIRTGLNGLEADLAAGLNEKDERVLLRTIELFGALENVSSTEPLLNILPSAGPKVRAAIHTTLLRLHYYDRLADAINALDVPTTDPDMQLLQYRSSIYIEEIREPKAVPELINLSRSRSDLLRKAAVYSLRKIATPAAVPAFVTALHDPLWGIRYDAAMGLATVESRPDLAASVEEFKQAESKYIAAWEQWWSKEGQAKYQR